MSNKDSTRIFPGNRKGKELFPTAITSSTVETKFSNNGTKVPEVIESCEESQQTGKRNNQHDGNKFEEDEAVYNDCYYYVDASDFEDEREEDAQAYELKYCRSFSANTAHGLATLWCHKKESEP